MTRPTLTARIRAQHPFSASIREEIIAALWAICALLAFGFGFRVWGWIFAIKAGTDTAITFYCATLEAISICRKSKEAANG
jgi:predicted membrane protein